MSANKPSHVLRAVLRGDSAAQSAMGRNGARVSNRNNRKRAAERKRQLAFAEVFATHIVEHQDRLARENPEALMTEAQRLAWQRNDHYLPEGDQ